VYFGTKRKPKPKFIVSINGIHQFPLVEDLAGDQF